MNIKKAQLDEFIELNRQYVVATRQYLALAHDDDERLKLLDKIWKMSYDVFDTKSGVAMIDVFYSIIRAKAEITNETIYKMLEVLGYEVTE